MTETWWLDSAEALQNEAPESFFIPPTEKRRSLKVGDHVKLQRVRGERMAVA